MHDVDCRDCGKKAVLAKTVMHAMSAIRQVFDRAIGSSFVSGAWRDQQFDQSPRRRLASSPDLGDERDEPQVRRRVLRRDPPVPTHRNPAQPTKPFGDAVVLLP
jgi:hypothetical protein